MFNTRKMSEYKLNKYIKWVDIPVIGAPKMKQASKQMNESIPGKLYKCLNSMLYN